MCGADISIYLICLCIVNLSVYDEYRSAHIFWLVAIVPRGITYMTGIRATFCAFRFATNVKLPLIQITSRFIIMIPRYRIISDGGILFHNNRSPPGGVRRSRLWRRSLLQLTSIIGSDMASGEQDYASTQTNIQ